jgi:hypothetical protein
MNSTEHLDREVDLLRSEDELREVEDTSQQRHSAEISVPGEDIPVRDIADPFSLFKDYLDKQLSSLKEDLRDDAISSTESVAKKLKESSEITFKYEGNKRQHKFNVSLA